MNFNFLVSFATCLSVQLCLACFLLFIDVRAYRRSTGNFYGHVYFSDKILIFVCSVLEIGLLIASLVGITVTFRLGRDMGDWIEAGVMCSLQLGAGTSLARLLQVFQYPRWNVWLTYVVAFIMIPGDISMYLVGDTHYVDKLPVLALAIASILCAAVSCSQLKSHKSSGLQQPDRGTSRLFTVLMGTNFLAAAVQFCGVIVLDLEVLVEEGFRVQMRQSVLLACTCTHMLCCLPACYASIVSCFTRLAVYLRNKPSLAATESDIEMGFVGLVTVETSQSSRNGVED